MPASVDIRAVGIKDALRELNTMDKRLRRQITRDYNEIVQPIKVDAKSLAPSEPPLSGFARSWTPDGSSVSVLPWGSGGGSKRPKVPGNWQQSKQGRAQMRAAMRYDANIRAYVSGKKPTTVAGYTRNLAAFGIRWIGVESAFFDTSGQSRTPQGARMVAALNAKYGPPSRVMWRAYEKSADQVQRNMSRLVNRVMVAVGRELA